MQRLQCWNVPGVLRLIQSIPSPKAEPFKRWLAKVGYERLQEIADPALALERTRENWRKLGRSEKWITQRMTGQETRNKLTDYWASHEVKQGQEFANPNAQICTQGNQCGCTPADFATIMEQNPLLGYNPNTYTTSPDSGTAAPLAYDSSGEVACGYDQPAGYRKFLRARTAAMSSFLKPGPTFRFRCSSTALSQRPYQQSDSTTTSFTTTANQSYNIGLSYTAGPLVASLKNQYTWTWADSQGIGTSTGGTNTMSVTLNTWNANCQEEVNLYEDTLYHTYVFQAPNSCP